MDVARQRASGDRRRIRDAFRLGKEVDGAHLPRGRSRSGSAPSCRAWSRTRTTVDPIIRQALTEDWPLSRLDSTLRAILRAGVYELMKREDVPVAVIVSEYVDIAKAFYSEDEPKLVNAVLDRASRRVRGEGRGKDALVTGRTPAEREARRTALILAATQAIVGSAAVVAISLGALAGQYLLDAGQVAGDSAGHRLQRRRGDRRHSRSLADPHARPAQRIPGRDRHDGAWRTDCDSRAAPVQFLAVRRRPAVVIGLGGAFVQQFRFARGGQRTARIQGARHLLRACRRRLHRHHRPADRHLHARSACAGDVRGRFRGDPQARRRRRAVLSCPCCA